MAACMVRRHRARFREEFEAYLRLWESKIGAEERQAQRRLDAERQRLEDARAQAAELVAAEIASIEAACPGGDECPHGGRVRFTNAALAKALFSMHVATTAELLDAFRGSAASGDDVAIRQCHELLRSHAQAQWRLRRVEDAERLELGRRAALARRLAGPSGHKSG